MSKPTLEITKDFTAKFNETIKRYKNDSVQVGIPATDDPREDKTPINNATLLAIATFGSPANNIPARPALQIGIKNAQEAIAQQFKTCVQQSLEKGVEAIETYYERAGIIASNSAKKAINDQDGIKAPSEATLAARAAAGFKGTKALIVSGQMRNSITYVVRSLWGL